MEDIWKGDKLDRKSDALYIQRYLENLYSVQKREDGFVLNVNSRWGGGKTFFLERLEMQLQTAGYMTVFYSAWKNDYSSEPLISFVASVEEALLKKLPKTLKPKARGLAKLGLRAIKPLIPAVAAVLVRQLTGLSIEKLMEITNLKEGESLDSKDGEAIKKIFGDVASKTADSALKDYKNSKISIDKFHEKLSGLVVALGENKRQQLPIFIFIDELDRCRPTFSIELLECIKHLFSVKGMYFIVATDTEQLSHSINAVYGEKFESDRYLRRFFDVEYLFRKPDFLSFVIYLRSRLQLKAGYYIPPVLDHLGQNVEDENKVIAGIFEGLNLALRDQEQAYFIIHTVCLLNHEKRIHLLFLSFIVALKIKEYKYYLQLRGMSSDRKIPDVLRSQYKLQEIQFDTHIKVSGGGGRPGQRSLLTLIEFYVGLSGRSLKDLSVMDWESQGSNLEMHIMREISQTLSKMENGKFPSLPSYFDIVEQAGRLSFPQAISANDL